MSPTDVDPSVVRSIAVTAEDVVAALEANRSTDRTVVFRITPPFSGRMRARIHAADVSTDASETDAIHVDPDDLLTASAPAYPRPADTEDALREDADHAYDVDRHRDRHVAALREWRSAVLDSVRDSIHVETPDGRIEVCLYVLD